jgi:hypothetical protein
LTAAPNPATATEAHGVFYTIVGDSNHADVTKEYPYTTSFVGGHGGDGRHRSQHHGGQSSPYSRLREGSSSLPPEADVRAQSVQLLPDASGNPPFGEGTRERSDSRSGTTIRTRGRKHIVTVAISFQK